MDLPRSRTLDRPSGGWSVIRGILVAFSAALAAAGATAAIYGIASALGAFPDGVVVPTPGGEEPLTLSLVTGTATLAITLAAAVFTLFAWRSQRPIRNFRIAALAIFLVSLASPFTISGASGAMIASLLVMHLAVAIIAVVAFTVVLPPE